MFILKRLFWRFLFAVCLIFTTLQTHADTPPTGATQIPSFYFSSTKVFIVFSTSRKGITQISYEDHHLNTSGILYEGEIAEIGVNRNIGFSSPLVETVAHRDLTYTYAVTKTGQRLFFTDHGFMISHPEIPAGLLHFRAKTLLLDDDGYSLISLTAENDRGTYVFDHTNKSLIKISNRGLSDKEMDEAVIDPGLRILYVPPLKRDLDLNKLEMEAAFKPGVPSAVLNSSGQTIDPYEFLSGILTDVRENMNSNLEFSKADDEVIQKMLDVFERKEGGHSLILLGQSGTGKTTLIEGLARKLPRTWQVYSVPREALEQGGSHVGEIEKRINAMVQAAKISPTVFVFDEFHSLKGLGTHSNSSVDIIQMLKKYIASGELMVIATDTPEEYQRAFGSDPAVKRRFTEVRVNEPRGEELESKINAWVQAKSKIKLEPMIVKRLISVAADFNPGAHEPSRSIDLLQQVITDLSRAKRDTVDAKDIDAAAWHLYEAGPQDPKQFIEKNEANRVKMHERVIDQPQMVDSLMNLWREVNLGVSPKKHRSVLVVGPTGAGKSFGGQSFAKIALDDPERFLEIDATKYKNGNFDSLIGTARYSAEAPQGLLPEFLGGRGKGRNVIQINEVEKAHPDLIKILMEMLDTGKLQGGDGRTYYLGRSLVIFTSNRGADEIYPVGQGSALKRKELLKRLAGFTDKKVRDLFVKPSSKNLYDQSETWGIAELQRIDRAVAVAPPSFEGANFIVESHARQISKNLQDQNFYSLSIDSKIIEEIVSTYYVPEEGVRTLLQKTEDLINELHQEAVTRFDLKPNMEIVAEWDHREQNGESRVKLSVKGANKSAIVATPIKKTVYDNPLQDPEALPRLQNFEEQMAKRVFGQTEAIKIIARAVRTRALNPQNKIPGYVLLLGSTASGKTESARTMAEILYGDPNRLKLFNFGNIKSEHDWSNFFGSPRGIVGSETMSPFEKALNDFPEGMVIGFDELGNMGMDPSDPNARIGTSREDFLKRLYDMFEEGKWTSPLGKTYDLRKHFFVMASNEGQEFFRNLPNDDLRMAEWKRVSRRDFLRELLLKHGWPDPLLGRLGNNIALLKPLLRDEQIAVAKKEVGKILNEMMAAHEVKAIEVAPNFYERMAESFFSHDQGARSLRDVAQNAVVDLIGQTLIEYAMSKGKLHDARFVLDMSDNFAGRLRRNTADKTEREVILKLNVEIPGEETKIYESNVTRDAKLKRLASFKEASITAYHEAGHAVLAQPEKTGSVVEFITIRGEGNYGGYVRYKNEGNISTISRENVVARIAQILAGQLSQELAGYQKDSGWQSDLEQARKIAEQAVSTWGLTDQALSLPVKDGKVILNNRRVQDEISKIVEEGRVEADRLLRERWNEVRAVAVRLMIVGHMERDDFEKILEEARGNTKNQIKFLETQREKDKTFIPKRWSCWSALANLATANK